MMPLYRKLNYLVSNTAPEYNKTRMRTPFMRLTVGNWCNRLPGLLSSVNLSWQKDYPWEINLPGDSKTNTGDREGGDHMLILPHVLNVSVNYIPIHNFLPSKDIQSPFILPNDSNSGTGTLDNNQKWLDIATDQTLDLTGTPTNPTMEADNIGINKLTKNSTTIDPTTDKNY